MSEHAVVSPTPLRSTFNAKQHLSRVNGNEYLEVKWRLVWFREQYPDGLIETEIIDRGPDWVIFKAKVTAIDEDGRVCGIATGHNHGSADAFKDYLEKSETASIGRALAALGFGTQFCQDHEDGAPRRPVDAPVQIRQNNRQSPPQRTQASRPPAAPQAPPPSAPPPAPPEEYAAEQPPDDPMSERQRGFLERLAHERGMDLNALDGLAEQRFGVPYQWLGRQDASALISYLQQIPVP